MSIRPEHFPFGFAADQRKLAETFVANRQVELIERGPGAYARARIRIFKRSLEVWAERRDAEPVRFECECPHFENEGTGCAHLFALCLAEAAAEAAAAAPPEPDEDEPFAPTWAIDRGRSHGSRKFWIGAYDRGADGKLVAAKITASALVRAEGVDDAILKLLQPAAGGRIALDRGGGFAKPEGPWAVEDDAVEALLPQLLASGRCVIDAGDGVVSKPLRDDSAGGPFQFVMRIVKRTPGLADSFSSVVGIFLREGAGAIESVKALETDLVVLGRKPFLVIGEKLAGIEAFDAYDWLKYFVKKEGPEVPPGEIDAFLARLAAGGPLPRLWLADEPAPLPIVREPPTPTLSITKDRGDATARLTFTYADVPATAVGRDALVFDAPTRRHLRRDVAAEEVAARGMIGAGAVEDLDVYGRYILPEGPLETFASAMLDRGFRIFVDGSAQRRSTGGRLRLVSGEDWFELRGGLEFDADVVPIPLVFDALKKGRRFVELKGGGQGLIPDDFADRWRMLDELGVRKGDAIRLRKTQGLVLDALIAERGKEIEARSEDLESMRDALASLRTPAVAAAPTGLSAELRPYQVEGLSWLLALDASGYGGCLADDMGLGKTVQAIALLLHRKKSGGGPHLVVLPRSLVFNWRNELARFAPSLKVLDHAALAKDARSSDFGDADVVLTTYGIVRRDAEELSKATFDWIVLDESQAVKNSTSQNSKAVRLLKARRRLVMTGTPIENRPEELWSQFEFLNPGMLGKESEFGRLARGERTRLVLARVVKPLILRRTKEQVARDLPEKIEQVVYCELTPEQERVYDEVLRRTKSDVMERVAKEGLGASKLHVLEALLRLRQAAAHPALVAPEAKDATSGKFEALLELLEEPLSSGRKALIFSQFPSVLKLLRPELVKLGVASEYLDGTTKDRESPVRRFQEDPNVSVLLASLMVGGHGLNLTAADYVFILDPWWNPAVEAQAVARAHRIGRTGAVVALRLVARGTVEEKMLALQEKKRDLAANLLDASGPVSDLTADDLLLLFGR